ncbi:MAG: mandelate racemase [Candidatus Bathyarchaeota archaeon]|nr:mandelate racemase [Candidatus Bathyarchaeota archaeon]
MKDKPKITKIELRQFEYQFQDVRPHPTVSIPIYEPGAILLTKRNIIQIFTDIGITGEYLGGGNAEYAALPMLVPLLIGRNALERDSIYNDAKHALQQNTPSAICPVDIALWDLAGKFYDSPLYELLGGCRTRIPCYASTYLADRQPDGLNSPEAFADFAQQCLELGYRGYKTHPWESAPIEEWVATNHAIARKVGGKMDLMVDAHCALRTFGEALKLGWSCDEERFFWLEDPFMHGESAFPHRKLRQMIKTPLLQMEHVRGLEAHIDMIIADGSDFVRGDIDYDGGITGVMKIAHAAEGFGLDIELHRPGPAQRHIAAAIRNNNYYESALVHPKAQELFPHIYNCDYSDGLAAIDENGCVPVPQGPGLGIEYDWDYINKHTISVVSYP